MLKSLVIPCPALNDTEKCFPIPKKSALSSQFTLLTENALAKWHFS